MTYISSQSFRTLTHWQSNNKYEYNILDLIKGNIRFSSVLYNGEIYYVMPTLISESQTENKIIPGYSSIYDNKSYISKDSYKIENTLYLARGNTSNFNLYGGIYDIGSYQLKNTSDIPYYKSVPPTGTTTDDIARIWSYDPQTLTGKIETVPDLTLNIVEPSIHNYLIVTLIKTTDSEYDIPDILNGNIESNSLNFNYSSLPQSNEGIIDRFNDLTNSLLTLSGLQFLNKKLNIPKGATLQVDKTITIDGVTYAKPVSTFYYIPYGGFDTLENGYEPNGYTSSTSDARTYVSENSNIGPSGSYWTSSWKASWLQSRFDNADTCNLIGPFYMSFSYGRDDVDFLPQRTYNTGITYIDNQFAYLTPYLSDHSVNFGCGNFTPNLSYNQGDDYIIIGGVIGVPEKINLVKNQIIAYDAN